MKQPAVFIILLNWNRLDEISDCLESLRTLEYANRSTVIVDNGSTDGSVDLLRARNADVTVIENGRNLGYTGGNNVGMRYAIDHGADYVWLLNNDTVVEPDALGKLVATAESSPNVGQVSPVIRFYEDRARLQFHGAYPDWKHRKIVSQVAHGLSVDDMPPEELVLSGAALLIKRSVIESVGYMDEKLFAYWEDHDYSVRVNRAGFRNVLNTDALVYHKTKVPEQFHVARAPYYYFYTNRNEYFFWGSRLTPLRRLAYVGEYMGSAMADVGHCLDAGSVECADACLDGAYCALRGIGGSWEARARMPETLKRALRWRPYFWMRLFKGQFSVIASEAISRLKQGA